MQQQTNKAKWSKSEIGFILFNNRSTYQINDYINTDRTLSKYVILEHFIQSLVNKTHKRFRQQSQIVIDDTKYDFNFNANDIYVVSGDLSYYNNLFSVQQFTDEEFEFLNSVKGFSIDYLHSTSITGLAHILDKLDDTDLDILGLSIHPTIRNVVINDLSNCVCFPLFDDNRNLINLTIRRISGGKMKYSQAIPCTHVYSAITNVSKRCYISEGLTDMHAIAQQGGNAYSVSSANWNAIQLLQLKDDIILHCFDDIVIFADNDKTGIRSAAILRAILSKMLGQTYNITICVSECAKDANEHCMQFNYASNVKTIDKVDDSMLAIIDEQPFDITKYLIERQF